MHSRVWTKLAAVAALAVFPLGASATSLNGLPFLDGEISFFGLFNADDGDLSAATLLTFPDPVFVGESLGDFAMGGPATATFVSLDLTGGGGALFTTDTGLSFTADGVTYDFVNATQIDVTISGIYSMAGFLDTAGFVVLTGNTVAQDIFTFSAVGAVVPVPAPAALLLLGSALAGLGLRRRKTV